MSDDYRVKSRSDLEIRQLAKRARDFFGVSKHPRVDVLACLKGKTVWTVSGEKGLNFQTPPDTEMGAKDGSTSFGKRIVTIAIKQSVCQTALIGDGRSRNTLAHELGHAVMH